MVKELEAQNAERNDPWLLAKLEKNQNQIGKVLRQIDNNNEHQRWEGGTTGTRTTGRRRYPAPSTRPHRVLR